MTLNGTPTGGDGRPLYIYCEVQRSKELEMPGADRAKVEKGVVQPARTADGKVFVLWPGGREEVVDPAELVKYPPDL